MTMITRIIKVLAIGAVLTSVAFTSGCNVHDAKIERLRQDTINNTKNPRSNNGSAMGEALASMRRAFK
ncbi:MAG: hypothetical protein ATN34_03775 [Epulopiscium sp. Nele67-Bin002]|nr:MAG: hypothetical protein BEN18_03375 [Epulopiscium sp. Nuni2H_MBin001]OON91880.1 MAG: hypothetical protein ATN34_03775 [Epulopiscium sp. Nele67-Bin002]OON91959.1 MAG: hypothetical protein ATN33_08205 [Epulopiscium sp. Nele67-Bin001]